MSDSSGGFPRLRTGVLAVVVVSLFVALFARLWYLQVLVSPELDAQALGNRVRATQEEGRRGRILDRNGKVLVDNRQSLTVTLDREVLGRRTDREAVILRLVRELNDRGQLLKVADVEERLVDPRYDPLEPVPIAADVDEDFEVFVLERSRDFPGVDIVRTYVRTYPYGTAASHILGYTGAINREELDARSDSEKPYHAGDEIGKAGIERIYEADLRARPGEQVVEIDASNAPVRVESSQRPGVGSDVRLTIDLGMQTMIEEELATALAELRLTATEDGEPPITAPAGAAVVLDPRNGEILAMASYPSYDPREFVGGINPHRFRQLSDPSSYFPLNNRAVQGQYPPASTFKLITSVAALELGLISPDDIIDDPGFYRLEVCQGEKCEWQNANRARYGEVDLRRAITVSSDVYYYGLGEKLWLRRDDPAVGDAPIQDTAAMFGFGTQTGVQLPFEGDGVLLDPDAKRQRHDAQPDIFPFGQWFTGDSVNLAIGQGDIAVTPLQLANAYATFANGGTQFAPGLVQAIIDPVSGRASRAFEPRVNRDVDLPDAIRQPILDGLVGVIQDPRGTAYDSFRGFPLDRFPMAGKTGTAQVAVAGEGVADTALFAAFGPVDDPRYTVVVVLEQAGFGADAAAPLVRRIFERLEPDLGPAPSTTSTTARPAPARSDASVELAGGDQPVDAHGASIPGTTLPFQPAPTEVPSTIAPPPTTSTSVPPAPPPSTTTSTVTAATSTTTATSAPDPTKATTTTAQGSR